MIIRFMRLIRICFGRFLRIRFVLIVVFYNFIINVINDFSISSYIHNLFFNICKYNIFL
nr:MAG TPA: hypothetical protein [Caudoviricetes sp.]